MPVWELIFWISLALVFYNYLGYAILVYIINLFRGNKKPQPVQHYPTVSFIVAAYNEEDLYRNPRNSLILLSRITRPIRLSSFLLQMVQQTNQ